MNIHLLKKRLLDARNLFTVAVPTFCISQVQGAIHR